MDAATLAQEATRILAPFLPYLLTKAGEKAAEVVGEKFGAELWETAQELWGRLFPKVKEKPAALEAAQDVAANPEDEDAQAALRLQLRKLLSQDHFLAQEVARILEEARARGVTVAFGERSVAVGGDVVGSTIVTGDRNVVQQGKYAVQIEQALGVAIGDGARSIAQDGIVLIPVESSMVHAVGYDPRTRRLEVVFTSGKVYCYEDVPPEVFQGLLEAESKGRYMREYIIDFYPYRRGPCPRGM